MTVIDASIFWLRIDSLLESKHLTFRKLCKQIGVSYSTVSNQRVRGSLPKIEQLLDMAKFLNTSVEFLATGEKPQENLIPEAQAVQEDPELQALVRAIERDRRLLSAISAVVRSYEEEGKLARG